MNITPLTYRLPVKGLENCPRCGTSLASNDLKEVEIKTPAPAKSRKSSATIGDLQNMPRSAWRDGDLIVGLQFFATLQLRTPLCVLQWHGRVHTNRHKPPPKVAKEGWEGIWLPRAKTFREIGIDLPDMNESTVASDIGARQAVEYVPFLIGIHEIVESNLPLSVREVQSREFLSRLDVLKQKTHVSAGLTWVFWTSLNIVRCRNGGAAGIEPAS